MCACLSQVRDPSFAHGAGDGLHRRAQRVEQRGQLPGALGPPSLLHHEAGHGDHVGVERPAVGHACCLGVEAAGRAAGLKCAETRKLVAVTEDGGANPGERGRRGREAPPRARSNRTARR